MEKKIVVLLFILLLLFSGFALVEAISSLNRNDDIIDGEEIALGGLRVGMSRSEVEDICGAPTERTEPRSVEIRKGPVFSHIVKDSYIYGTSLCVDFERNRVARLKSDARGGIATPAGIEVGDTVEEMQRIYGAGQRSSLGNKDVFRYSSSPSNAGHRIFSMQVSAQEGVITYIGISEIAFASFGR